MGRDELLTNTGLLLIGIPIIPLLFIATEFGRLYSTSSIENDMRPFGAA